MKIGKKKEEMKKRWRSKEKKKRMNYT